MTSNKMKLAGPLFLLAVSLLLTSPAFAAAEPVGKLFFALRGVEIKRTDGALEKGVKGSQLFEGNQVITGEKGRAQIMFIDGARVALKPNTVFGIESYKKPAPANANGLVAAAKPGSATLSMLKGGIRAVSGGITKDNPDGMSVKTPVATMGIRGTDYSATLIKPQWTPNNPTASKEQQLLVGVRDGQVRITNARGSISVFKGEFGVASKSGAPKVSLEPPKGLIGGDESGDENTDDKDGSESSSDGDSANEASGEGSAEQSAAKPKQDSSGSDEADDSGQADDNGDSKRSEGSGDSSQSGSNASPEQQSNDQQAAPPAQPATQATAPENPPQSEGGTNLEDPAAVENDISEPGDFRATAFSGQLGASERQLVIGEGITDSSQTSLGSDGSARRFASDISGSSNEETTILSIQASNGQLSASNLELGADPETGFNWGRWAEGSATLTPGPSGETETATLVGQQSLHWLYGAIMEGDPLSDITASANYSLVGNTSPTDSAGNVGVLGVADLSANFTNRTVNLDIQMLINDQNWSASGGGSMVEGGVLPFSGTLSGTATQDGSPVDSLTGSYNGSFSPNVIDVNGSLVPAGAGLTYGLQGSSSQIVNGAAIVGSPTVQQGP